MNVERILQLADIIEVQPHVEVGADEGFNMAGWKHPCGTPSCIAGWAAKMSGEYDEDTGLGNMTAKLAREWMDLGIVQSDRLFTPILIPPLSNITPSQAAKTLRHLAHTGEVKWEL